MSYEALEKIIKVQDNPYIVRVTAPEILGSERELLFDVTRGIIEGVVSIENFLTSIFSEPVANQYYPSTSKKGIAAFVRDAFLDNVIGLNVDFSFGDKQTPALRYTLAKGEERGRFVILGGMTEGEIYLDSPETWFSQKEFVRPPTWRTLLRDLRNVERIPYRELKVELSFNGI